jgi:predicted nucleic acid-binding protein
LIRYFDASALVKRYVAERGSRSVARLLAAGDAATSRLSEVELVSALTRRAREGDLAAADGDRAIAALADDLAALHIVELLPDVTALARSLLRRHALRAADAVQLASCLYLGERLAERIPFVAYDRRLRTAARAERLQVLPSRLRPTR